MFELFRLGGWGMFPTLAFGLVAIGVCARYALRPERRLVPLVVALNGMVLVLGALGFVTGLIASCRALEHFPASERYAVVIGVGESLVNLALAFAIVALGGMACVVGAWRIARARPAAA